MSLIVLVKVQTIDRTTYFLILQHTLGTISKRDNRHTLTANGNRSCQIIHLCITDIRSNIAVCPCIQDARTIDAEQYTKTGLIGRMIDMGKSIYATLLVIVHLTEYTINDTRCSGCSSNLTRIQHIQGEGIVGLVSTPISDWCTLLQSHLSRSCCTHLALNTESRNDVCNQILVESIIVEQEVSHLIVLEVPKHTLRQTADRRVHCSTKTHGNIISWQHHLIYIII